ncbi:N-acetyltransferase [Sphaerisporangium sp. TRM90804]|uniref:N-acetyltransferase n=1 Tax=Sphaerisporangium sp. TRM90804 TaxID=3031113 RepID=UPI0024469BB5|nr:N-acetyltransferase [Sphaerisporangium sp. TRM90804]MDH2425300.1 N-acetyltransferase [Sphaerisporangium sp. TRM90804]
MDLHITTLAERPELAPELWRMPDTWPVFMKEDPAADLYYPVAATRYAEYTLVATDPADPGVLVARAFSVPFVLGGDELPDDGWDGVLWRATVARRSPVRRSPDAISALEITIRSDLLGKGLSAVMLRALRARAARLGFRELLAPVRPSGKHLRPRDTMAGYAALRRDDGLPVDPWLRVHARAGGVIEKVAPRSMVVAGTLAEWRRWTGLPFDTTGDVEVPGALVPVHCDAEHDHAVYVEPNVWVRHPVG